MDQWGNNDWHFIKTNHRPPGPRTTRLTEIRGPYYTAMGKRYTQDVLETQGNWIDGIKSTGGAFTLFPFPVLKEFIDTAHQYNILVATGDFMEYVPTQGKDAVHRYIQTCKEAGFDIIENSSGFITLPTDDWLRLMEWVMQAGMKAKPEVCVQFGAGGATATGDLKKASLRNAGYAIKQAQHFLEAGVDIIMFESEGITENTEPWRTDVVTQFIDGIGLEHLMFEAAEPS
ncbi:MAG: phosphosulfolactate synthase, partial [Flavisolibacter sp.]|nr:phosphosulfolactate synthase [Flavisolibacter sp.]